jgi:hypothetical protein
LQHSRLTCAGFRNAQGWPVGVLTEGGLNDDAGSTENPRRQFSGSISFNFHDLTPYFPMRDNIHDPSQE